MDDLRELPPCFWDMDGKCSRIAASWHLPREPTLGEAQSCESRRRGLLGEALAVEDLCSVVERTRITLMG